MKPHDLVCAMTVMTGTFAAIYFAALIGIEPPGMRLFARRAPDAAERVIHEARLPTHDVWCMIRKP